MKITKNPIGTWHGMNTVVISPGQNAEAEIAKSDKPQELLQLYALAKLRMEKDSVYENGIKEYTLVRAEDARAKGVIDDDGRVHRTSKQLHPDCLAIIDYINSHGMMGGGSTPRWTTPVALVVLPELNGAEFKRGYAITASGSMYILDGQPMTLEALAAKYPAIMKP